MDDKDRLGDKLRKKEKADEDAYFAKRDKELTKKLQDRVEADDEEKTRKLAHMRCPKCGDTLVAQEREGITADSCPSCKGVWLDQGELERVVEHDRKTGWITRYLELIRRR
jgi:phage FluMu protein Com